MWIIWTIVIGFIAGVLAKFVTPGDRHEPQGFILTTALGIGGAFVMTYLGQALGWYQEGQSTGFHWRDLGRRSNSISVGLYRVEESNALIPLWYRQPEPFLAPAAGLRCSGHY